jgi:MFS family permease
MRQSSPVTPDRAPGARRDLLLLLGGNGVSVLGSSVTLLAVVLHLRPAGPGWVAVASGAELVPLVLGAPLAGLLVDRFRNRQLLAGALVVQAVAVLLAAGLALGPGREPLLAACLVLLGSATAVASPCVGALLPRITGEDRATRAYGWYSAINQAGFLGGFALAGILVGAFGTRTALLVDAASFLAMAGAVGLIRAQRDPRADAEPATGDPGRGDQGAAPVGPAPASGSAWAGFALIGRDAVLRVACVGLAVAVLVSIIVNVAEVFFTVGVLGVSPAGYGLLTALWPLAGIGGAWLAGRLSGDRALMLALAVAAIAMGLGLLLVGWLVAVYAVVIAWLLGGAANAAQVVSVNALVRSRTTDAQRGRAFAANSALLAGANLTGLAVGAVLVGAVGPRLSLLLSGAVTVAAGLVVAACTPRRPPAVSTAAVRPG